jgi:hypothetical protein
VKASDEDRAWHDDFFARASAIALATVRRNREESDFLFDKILSNPEFHEHFERDQKKPRNTGPRPGGSNQHGRADYQSSLWARFLRENEKELRRPGSNAALLFRRRFRVPYVIFLQLLEWTKAWHEKGATDAFGRERIPTELKLLGVLRVLGRATCFDGIQELSGISVPTMCAFFHEFTSWFAKEVSWICLGSLFILNSHQKTHVCCVLLWSQIYPKFVSPPKTKEELLEVSTAYAAVGLPGAIGSMDVVHIAWCMCPAHLSNLCTGKEGYPTIGYNVVCDHSGRARETLKGSLGSFNDKTVVVFDEFVANLRTNPFFTKFAFEVMRSVRANDREMVHGAYVVVDGGYHQWEATQAASRLNSDPDYQLWRARVESVRKDIEDFFGRLKSRFRILKTPIAFHKKENIDDMFLTCVALQNILLDWDEGAGEASSWEVEPTWGDFADDDGEDEEAQFWARPKLRRAKRNKEVFTPQAQDDFSGIGRFSFPLSTITEIGDNMTPNQAETARYMAKQEKLVAHFKYACQLNGGSMPWLRS